MTGDGCYASFDGPARAVHCAQAITGAVRDIACTCAPESTPARSS